MRLYMKFKFEIKKQKYELEADVETLVEKGMEQHERTWKDKFNSRHSAKKEILELKHKQKKETEEQNAKKKNWFQKIEEEKRKTKELELQFKIEEERRSAEEQRRIIKTKTRVTTVLGIIGSLLLIIGYALGSASKNGDSGWDGLLVVGFLILISIPFIWKEKKNKKDNKKRIKK